MALPDAGVVLPSANHNCESYKSRLPAPMASEYLAMISVEKGCVDQDLPYKRTRQRGAGLLRS